jgi:iron complex outermembrane receptor protein
MNFKSKMMFGVGVTMLTLAANGTAQAQSAASSSAIGEVVVTATKAGVTNLQKTPLAVSVVGGDDLQASQVVNIRELQSLVPALRVTQNSAEMILYVRGVGGRQIGGESGVSIYVDGVYLSRQSAALSSNFNDLARVEVLKGPQGTTFGRNSAGGAVNFISRAPTDEFSIRSTINAGNYRLYELSTNISGPIIKDKLQGSIALSRVKHDGYIENIVPGGQDLGKANRWAARGQLRWTPTDRIVNTLRAEVGYTDEAWATRTANIVKTNDSRLTGANNYNAPLANSILGDYSKVAVESPARDREQAYGVNNEFVFTINDNMTLRSLTAYRSDNNLYLTDGDVTELRISCCGSNYYNNHHFSEELNLEHKFGRLSGVVGLYYFDEYLRQRSNTINPVSVARATGSRTFQDSLFPSESAAIFVQETFQITDSVSVLAGARYTKERKGFDQFIRQEVYNPGFANDHTLSGFGQFTAVTHKWLDPFTPKIGVNWQASDNAFFYASVTKGYKNGGYSASSSTLAGAYFGPENLWSYEVGAKTDWFDKRLRANVSFFKYDYKGLQFTTVIGPQLTATTNAAAAELNGFDVELTAKPIKGLTLTADGSFLPKAEYTDFKTLSASANYRPFLLAQGDPKFNNATGVYDASGSRIINAPEVAMTVTAQQDFDRADGSMFFVRGEYNYTSLIDSDATNVKIGQQPPVTLYHASFGYIPKGGKWDIAVWGRNLGDKQWVNLITPTPRPVGNSGAPRTYGVRLNWNY